MIALLERRHARPHLDHDARALMAHDRREEAFRIGAGNRELVGMANAGRLDLDQHFALLRAFEIDLDDFQGLGLFKGNGGAGFHSISPSNRDCRHPRLLG